jgi:hypothetical protein
MAHAEALADRSRTARPTIRITGPFSNAPGGPSWRALRNCKGLRPLAVALGVRGTAGPDTDAGMLRRARVLKRARRLAASGHAQGTHAFTGGRAVTTKLDRTLRLTRLARRPAGL